MLERWSVLKRKKDHVREVLALMEGGVTEVASLKEGDGHVTEVITLMEGERSSEGQKWSV